MKFADSTAERCQVVGTAGVISLLGNINKHRTFSNAGLDGEVYIRVETSAGLWEVSVGEFDSEANTITRTEFVSSITGSAINFPAGTHTCYSVLPASKVESGGPGFVTFDETGAEMSVGAEGLTITINPAAQEGENIAGSNLILGPSKSTGNGQGGKTVLTAGVTGSSGNLENENRPTFQASEFENQALLPIALPEVTIGDPTDLRDGRIAWGGTGLAVTFDGFWVAA